MRRALLIACIGCFAAPVVAQVADPRASLSLRLDAELRDCACRPKEGYSRDETRSYSMRALLECGERGLRAATGVTCREGDPQDDCALLLGLDVPIVPELAATCIAEARDSAELRGLVRRVNARGLGPQVADVMISRAAPGAIGALGPRGHLVGRIGRMQGPDVMPRLLDLVEGTDRFERALGETWQVDPDVALDLLELAIARGDLRGVTEVLHALELHPHEIDPKDAVRFAELLEREFPDEWLTLTPWTGLSDASHVLGNLLWLGPIARPAVRRLAASPDAGQRRHAVMLLGSIGDEPGSPVLRAALGDPDRSVRDLAIGALLLSEGCNAIGDIEVRLNDDDAIVRRRAALALAACGDRAASALLQAPAPEVPSNLAGYERIQNLPAADAVLAAMSASLPVQIPRARTPPPRPPREMESPEPVQCCATSQGITFAILDGPPWRTLEALRSVRSRDDYTPLLQDAVLLAAQSADPVIADEADRALVALRPCPEQDVAR